MSVFGPSVGRPNPSARFTSAPGWCLPRLPPLSIPGEGRAGARQRGGELADDLLDDVLEREKPHELAVLIDDQGDALSVLLEILHLGEYRRARRHEVRLVQHLFERRLVERAGGQRGEYLLQMQHPDHLAERAAENGQPPVMTRDDLVDDGVDVVIQAERFDLGARHHDVLHRDLTEVEQVHENRDVLLRQHVGVFEQDGANLFRGHFAGVLAAAHACDGEQRVENRVRRRGEHRDKRRGDAREHPHRPCHEAGDAFGIVLPEALRDELADHDGDVRNGYNDAHRRDDVRGLRREREVACSHPDTGAERKASPTMPFRMPIDVMPIWMVDRNRVGSRASARADAASRSPMLRARFEPRLARRQQRHFRHGEQAVQDNKAGEEQDFHGGVRSAAAERTSRTKRLPT